VVLLELLKINLSDSDYSFEERDFIRNVSDAMEMSSNNLFVMRSWVEKNQAGFRAKYIPRWIRIHSC